MADVLESPPRITSQPGWCLALYPRLSRRARRRMAALLVAAALLAQPLASYARGDREAVAAGGNFRAPIAALHEPVPAAPLGDTGAADLHAKPAVARALHSLGLGAPAAPSALSATPAGSEFQVNTYTTSDQHRPSVAMDSDGDFVVVWHSSGSGGTDTNGTSIQGQRYNAAGSPQGSQFQVNTYTTSDQHRPSVAMDADGDFVVVWHSFGSSGTDTNASSIQGQRYNAAGSPQGSEFQVNTFTTSGQRSPAAAMDADGDFVVVWESNGSGGTDTSDYSIQGQRYNAAGSPQGSQFQVNTYTTIIQRFSSVAMDADGDFVVVWQSYGSGGTDTSSFSIQGQRYNAAGSPQGSEFQVNTYTTGNQRFPSVALDADGDFVGVWESNGSGGTDTSSYSVQAQRYTAAGTPQGSQFQVNTFTTGNEGDPSVAMDVDGDFVVVWLSDGSSGTDTSGYSVQAQRYTAAGSPQGSEFQVNTYTTSNQIFHSVAMDADGDFVVVWQSNGSGGTDTSSYSVQAQRYKAPLGTIRIEKRTSPQNSPGTFPFRNDIDDTIFLLAHGGLRVFADVPPGTYKVSEIDPSPDYLLLSIVCDDDNSGTGLLTATINLEAGETVTCTFTNAPKIQIPTGAQISRFAVDTDPTGRVVLSWETTTEFDVLGFQIERSGSPEGPFTRVARALVPARGGASHGARYHMTDLPGIGVYYYRLVVVGIQTPAEHFGPLPARVDALRAFLARVVRR